MAIPSDPYHSTNANDPGVHHVFADCPTGAAIEAASCAAGDNGYPLCDTCKTIED
jgi:hypothetical protein